MAIIYDSTEPDLPDSGYRDDDGGWAADWENAADADVAYGTSCESCNDFH